MITSADDASLLFDRWRQDARLLKLRLWSASLFFDAMGAVADFNPESLELGGDSWRVTLPLTGATFSFSDPREVGVAPVRENEASRYEFGIAVELPNGDRLIIMELKVSAPNDGYLDLPA